MSTIPCVLLNKLPFLGSVFICFHKPTQFRIQACQPHSQVYFQFFYILSLYKSQKFTKNVLQRFLISIHDLHCQNPHSIITLSCLLLYISQTVVVTPSLKTFHCSQFDSTHASLFPGFHFVSRLYSVLSNVRYWRNFFSFHQSSPALWVQIDIR